MKSKVFHCPICTKLFKAQARFTRHVSSHSGGSLFTCPFCPKAFEHDYKLRSHITNHNDRKPYLCPMPDCKKRCTTNGAMKSHSEHAHKQMNYSYKDCEQFHKEDEEEVEHDLVTGSLVL